MAIIIQQISLLFNWIAALVWCSAFYKIFEHKRKKIDKLKIFLFMTLGLIGAIIYIVLFDYYFISKEIVSTCLEMLQYE
jgi:hypothetical protein